MADNEDIFVQILEKEKLVREINTILETGDDAAKYVTFYFRDSLAKPKIVILEFLKEYLVLEV